MLNLQRKDLSHLQALRRVHDDPTKLLLLDEIARMLDEIARMLDEIRSFVKWGAAYA